MIDIVTVIIIAVINLFLVVLQSKNTHSIMFVESVCENVAKIKKILIKKLIR